jgi:hypothetical protein
MKVPSSTITVVITLQALTLLGNVATNNNLVTVVDAKLADRSRIVKARQDSGRTDRYHDNGRPIEGQSYRSSKFKEDGTAIWQQQQQQQQQQDSSSSSLHFQQQQKRKTAQFQPAPWQRDIPSSSYSSTTQEAHQRGDVPLFIREDAARYEQRNQEPEEELHGRRLSSQLTGCCYSYQNYAAADLCALYGNDCESGETPSHDSGDGSCEQQGLSFLGVSFSVNTASGNPYSYQLCDQFPMENIIDRNYDYIMSMDEDGWLVGGGYKTFDYSGKMP